MSTSTEKAIPYKLARLCDRNGDISKQWYIEFYVWNAPKAILERVQDTAVINKLATVKDRKDYAKKRIKIINELLIQGYHRKRDKSEIPAVEAIQINYTVSEAFKMVETTKIMTLRKKSSEGYSNLNSLFFEFAKLHNLLDIDIKSLKTIHIVTFLDYLQKEKKSSNATRNNKLQSITAVFNTLIERSILEKNPCKGIKKLPTEAGRNIAFTDSEIKLLKKEIVKCPLQLDLFIQMIYYTFIRPGELQKLQLKQIDLVNKQIYVPPEKSKGRRGGYVSIPAPLQARLQELHLEQYPSDYYLFSPKKQPHSKGYKSVQLSRAFAEILEKLGFGEEYTLYSWKHTGVVKAYRSGIDIKAIQLQCRHKDLSVTDRYLKSLGLLKNKEIEVNFPEF